MRKLILILLLALPLTGCKLITVPEFFPDPFDADGDDIVQVKMDLSFGDARQRCADMGGITITYTADTVGCWNVDK